MANTTVIKHAFLTPTHNAWSMWTADGATTLTNPGTTHRTLESLSFVLDQMAMAGWKMTYMFVGPAADAPTLISFTREEPAVEEPR